MSYESIVYRILIASPSDVDEEREVTSRIIQEWNDLNSFNKKIVLLPVKWETHTHPTYGARPQETINKQIVDDCDLLIGFFWTKIGTPTGVNLSGTIEEIKRVSNAGKPVMLYFSKIGKDPSQIDTSQLDSLNKFKDEVYKIALVENYSTLVEFRDKVSRQLEMKIREIQSQKQSKIDLVGFSFIDLKTEKLTKTSLTINIERLEIAESRVKKILASDKRIAKRKWEFGRHLTSYLNKKNNYPVVFGLENKIDRIIGNVITEFRLKSSDESIVIQSMGSLNDDFSTNNIGEYDLSKEFEQNIRKLFKNDLTQTSANTWEFSLKQFTLLPNKIRTLDTVLVIYPKTSLKLEIHLTIFSENILLPIEKTCEIIFKVKKRDISDDELSELIKTVPDDDDLPF